MFLVRLKLHDHVSFCLCSAAWVREGLLGARADRRCAFLLSGPLVSFNVNFVSWAVDLQAFAVEHGGVKGTCLEASRVQIYPKCPEPL